MSEKKKMSKEEKMMLQMEMLKQCEAKIAALKKELVINKKKRSKLRKIIAVSMNKKKYEGYQNMTGESIDTLKCKVKFARLLDEKEHIEKEINKTREILESI